VAGILEEPNWGQCQSHDCVGLRDGYQKYFFTQTSFFVSSGTVWMQAAYCNAQNPLDTFPRNFAVDEDVTNLLPTCCGLVIDLLIRTRFAVSCYSDTANYLDMSLTCPMLATSRCNGIWETTRYNRHTRSNLLRTCYGETGTMDFGKICYGEVANLLLRTCRLCCGLVTDTTGKSSTCLVLLRTCYGETDVMNFGL